MLVNCNVVIETQPTELYSMDTPSHLAWSESQTHAGTLFQGGVVLSYIRSETLPTNGDRHHFYPNRK